MAQDVWGLGGAWTPITFSAEFLFRMRKQKDRLLAGEPSTRQAIAIPKLLTARYHRKHTLIPEDYIQAAVITTPITDQEIARQIAFQILFPQARKPPSAASGAAAATSTADELTDTSQQEQQLSGIDKIMKEMAMLGDVGNELGDSSALDEMIDQELKAMDKLLDFFDKFTESTDPNMQAMQDLLGSRGGLESLLTQGLSSEQLLSDYLNNLVRSEINSLTPQDIQASGQLGWGDEIINRTSAEWEKLAAQYVMKKKDFQQSLQNTMKGDPAAAAKKPGSWDVSRPRHGLRRLPL